MKRHVIPTLLIALALSVCAASLAAETRVTATQSADLLVVYVHDLDLLRAAHPTLTARLKLDGADADYAVDLAAQYQMPAICVRKKGAIKSVSVVLAAEGKEVFQKQIPVGPVQTAPVGVSLGEAMAVIQPGRHAPDPLPAIRQPDLAKLPPLEMSEATRRVKVADITVDVRSEANFPMISAKNNCAVSRQTEHPEDATLRSIYIPLKTQLYDQETGKPSSICQYLLEVPLKPEWATGDADETIALSSRDVNLHVTDKLWPPKGKRQVPITGAGSGGLGQLVGSVAVDDDGNVYYAGGVPPGVIRLNVKKGEFEAPPINIAAAMAETLPKKADLPAKYEGGIARFDWSGYVSAGGGRFYYAPNRYAKYRNALYCNGVFSFPTKHWDDAEKFRAEMKLIAASWPTSEGALYDKWPDAGEAARKITPPVWLDGKLYMKAYADALGGPWRIDLNPDGSRKAITLIDKKEYIVAARAAQPKLTERAGGRINWWNYGVIETSRVKIAQLLGGDGRGAKGDLTLFYDAVGLFKKQPEKYAAILNSMAGPSLAPCYMSVAIPEKPGHIIGIGEYGYLLADLDVAKAANGVVSKEYLPLDSGDPDSTLPARVPLGPYGRVWVKDGGDNYLFMPGYTGLALMKYSENGKPLERFKPRLLHPPMESLDGASPGGVKRVRYPVHGIDGRLFMTGSATADRAGTAYSSGLISLVAPEPKSVQRLSWMNRGCHTFQTRTRVVYELDGTKRQQIVLSGGGYQKGYILKMDEKDVPENQEPKIFLYDCPEGGNPRDLFGFTCPALEGKSGAWGQVFSRDRRFLITCQQGKLLSFDMDALRYVDGRSPDAAIWRFTRPDYRFCVSPDDRAFMLAAKADGASATFYTLDTTPDGRIVVAPHLTVDAPDAKALGLLDSAVISFVPDPSGDGSCDLSMGPYRRGPGTDMWVIRDFIAPRTQ